MNMRSFCGSEGEGSKGRYVENPFVLIGLGIKIFLECSISKILKLHSFERRKNFSSMPKKCVCV